MTDKKDFAARSQLKWAVGNGSQHPPMITAILSLRSSVIVDYFDYFFNSCLNHASCATRVVVPRCAPPLRGPPTAVWTNR